MRPQKARKTSRVSVDSKLIAEAVKIGPIKDKTEAAHAALRMFIANAKRKRVGT
ncbi:type II toxin-antitoxin system VapB family antitoxin [Nitrospira defluvii]|uniref:type II toxin-antitoxin system VapB family antitoxin n=1 Tax=Nitrospira defluvii TaxID=330214 RepID=UPI001BB471BB